MTRVNITDNDGGLVGWFDPDRAVEYQEDTYWDGQNLVSVNPVGQFGHQHLFYTAGGRWVLYTWSQYQGVKPCYEFVELEQAREWLLLNAKDAAVQEHFDSVEDERGPGRPEVGNAISVRLGDLLPRVDRWAALGGLNRATAVRELLAAGLDSQPGHGENDASLAQVADKAS